MDFSKQSLDQQKILRKDFKMYFEAFGELYLEFSVIEPHPPVEDDDLYEILMNPIFRKGNLACFIDDFLEGNTQTSVFHLGQECFVHFGFDMSVFIYHKNNLPTVAGLELLKVSKI